MASSSCMAPVHEATQGNLGLSDAAEQRWRQMTGGKHLFPNLYDPTQLNGHDAEGSELGSELTSGTRNSLPSLSDAAEQRWRQLMGGKQSFPYVDDSTQFNVHGANGSVLDSEFTPGTKSAMHPHDDAVCAFARGTQEGVAGGSGLEPFSLEGGSTAWAFTHLFLDDMFEDVYAQPMPQSFHRCVDTPPVVPPEPIPQEPQEWFVIAGYRVRMTRTEFDNMLADMEESGSEGDSECLSDTSVGYDSVRDDDDDDYDSESAEDW
eukprot:TRINITY_DN5792_c0_g2_i1.p1 TRINITY_DN5792_c0_g2~~TRINITY_DN5792_c0_g2_i1.p1  ORF type:complete len:292 (-),score=22.86 TRINITY_DN5792_c0_g2_i1:118-906(-)